MTDPSVSGVPFSRCAPYYDAIYQAKGKDYAAEVSWILEALGRHERPSRGRLLDVACGTGEHLRHLRAHFRAEGCDHSPEMLGVAKQKLPGVPFHHVDMRTMNLGRTYDVITCLFSSVGYLPDESGLERAMARMAEHLTPQGTLVIEPALTPDRLLPPETQSLTVDGDGGAIEGEWHLVRVTRATHEHGTLHITFEHELEHDGETERFGEVHHIRVFAKSVYERAFHRAGLDCVYDPDGPSGIGAFLGWMTGS